MQEQHRGVELNAARQVAVAEPQQGAIAVGEVVTEALRHLCGIDAPGVGLTIGAAGAVGASTGMGAIPCALEIEAIATRHVVHHQCGRFDGEDHLGGRKGVARECAGAGQGELRGAQPLIATDALAGLDGDAPVGAEQIRHGLVLSRQREQSIHRQRGPQFSQGLQ